MMILKIWPTIDNLNQPPKGGIAGEIKIMSETKIKCPKCEKTMTVYHMVWSAILCQGCKEILQNPVDEASEEALVCAYEHFVESTKAMDTQTSRLFNADLQGFVAYQDFIGDPLCEEEVNFLMDILA